MPVFLNQTYRPFSGELCLNIWIFLSLSFILQHSDSTGVSVPVVSFLLFYLDGEGKMFFTAQVSSSSKLLDSAHPCLQCSRAS